MPEFHIVSRPQLPPPEIDPATPFRSQYEMVKAMQDPRYKTDEVYRQDVAQKLARSPREELIGASYEAPWYPPTHTRGGPEAVARPPSTSARFATPEQVLRAMQDPRYKTDDAYRGQVEAMLAASPHLAGHFSRSRGV